MPLDAVRDLLGIARAMWLAWHEQSEPLILEELRGIGEDLAWALKWGQRSPPGTGGHRAAYDRAEDATRRLCKIIREYMPLSEIVKAAAARVVELPKPPRFDPVAERDRKREHRIKRG
jgi:hypothetical protein